MHISEFYQPKSAADLNRHYAAVMDRLSKPLPKSLSGAVTTNEIQEPLAQFQPVGKLFDDPIRPDSAKAIRDDVLRKYNFSLAELMSPARNQRIVKARSHLAYLLRWHKPWSLTQIAHFLGQDHTAVLHSIRRHCKKNGLPPILIPGEGGMYYGAI